MMFVVIKKAQRLRNRRAFFGYFSFIKLLRLNKLCLQYVINV